MSRNAVTKEPESLVLLNTGDGKGKTTAALGVIMRALAQGWRVGVIQFMKSDAWETGEENMFRRLGVEWLKSGEGCFTWNSDPVRSREKAQAGWVLAAAELAQGQFDLLVLDEITLPLKFGWLDEEEVARAVRERTKGMNVILTGRDAPDSLVELADTVTEMRSVRHPFDKGIVARAGIDY